MARVHLFVAIEVLLTFFTYLRTMRLLLIDGSYYAYRSFFAILELSNSHGEPTNAIYGFAKAVRKMVKDLQPDFAAVCWDEGLPLRRTQLQPDYKAHRKEMPDKLIPQIPLIRKLVPLLGLASVGIPQTEADDLIASYACEACKQNYQVVIATNDKDIFSLVDGKIKVYSTAKADLTEPSQNFALIGSEQIQKKWGVTPANILDVLALSGDSSDNIAGIPGVGLKTATGLIQTAGALEGIYANLAQVKSEKLRAKLLEGKDRVFQNREMVRLDTDLPLPVPVNELKITPKYPELIDVLERYEFRSLLTEIRAEYTKAEKEPPPSEKNNSTEFQGDLFPF